MMEADAGDTTILVLQGDHQFQAVVSIDAATATGTAEVNVADGSILSFNNRLLLNDNTLNKTGPGIVEINNGLNTGGGSVVVLEGTVAGLGTVGGSLLNESGTVSPGTSIGSLD